MDSTPEMACFDAGAAPSRFGYLVGKSSECFKSIYEIRHFKMKIMMRIKTQIDQVVAVVCSND